MVNRAALLYYMMVTNQVGQRLPSFEAPETTRLHHFFRRQRNTWRKVLSTHSCMHELSYLCYDLRVEYATPLSGSISNLHS